MDGVVQSAQRVQVRWLDCRVELGKLCLLPAAAVNSPRDSGPDCRLRAGRIPKRASHYVDGHLRVPKDSSPKELTCNLSAQPAGALALAG